MIKMDIRSNCTPSCSLEKLLYMYTWRHFLKNKNYSIGSKRKKRKTSFSQEDESWYASTKDYYKTIKMIQSTWINITIIRLNKNIKL